MAKKKKTGGVGIGLILVLIFFVLATFICGTVAYFGYSEQEQFKKQAKDAEDKVKVVQGQFREERARKILLRNSYGIADPADLAILITELETFKPQLREEYDNLLRELVGKLPTDRDGKPMKYKDATGKEFTYELTWPLLTSKSEADLRRLSEDPEALKNDPTNQLGVRPISTLPEMITALRKQYDTDIKRMKSLDDLSKEFVVIADGVQKSQGDARKEFLNSVAGIKKEVEANYKVVDDAFKKMQADRNNDGLKSADRIKNLGKDVNDAKDEIGKLNDKLKDLMAKLEKFDKQEREIVAKEVNLLVKEESKGKIVSKQEGDFVTIDIGSNRDLKAQTRFLVVAANVSWLSLEEKEASLKKYTLSNDRLPYEDNPYVKASIEVVEILGPDRARGKLLFENDRIRNPVQVGDQVFNPIWEPKEQIRIAFAGIIDLDGDGLDNNKEFLSQLERHGVIVDEYMNMSPLDFIKRDGRGMTLQTKYLIVADDPRFEGVQLDANHPQRKYVEAVLSKMSEIKDRATKLGVQKVDARKFVSLMGYKLPKGAAPLQYGSAVYWNNPGAVPIEELICL